MRVIAGRRILFGWIGRVDFMETNVGSCDGEWNRNCEQDNDSEESGRKMQSRAHIHVGDHTKCHAAIVELPRGNGNDTRMNRMNPLGSPCNIHGVDLERRLLAC
jgi:hypothetical protein